jgi:hypothetical protein
MSDALVLQAKQTVDRDGGDPSTVSTGTPKRQHAIVAY